MQPGLPEHFYIFANQAAFLTRHNLSVTGSLFSAAYTYTSMSPDALRAYKEGTLDYLSFDPSANGMPVGSPFRSSVISGTHSDYRVEVEAEEYRRSNYPLLPSRLSCVFAFGDEESCRAAASRHGWNLNEVKRFRLLPSPLNRLHRANMEIVSVARVLYRGQRAISPEWTRSLWEEYWAGLIGIPIEGIDNEGQRRVLRPEPPIWEWLIEGILHLDED